ncbi:hypothetical protein [Streptomyces sp. NBC_00154]|uniref:hypothetical protein n=1 Tax=Streptomyces sp. NBC_00154 TaxID=2975670 RepID=UPI00224ED3D2|nr:hypothetical protein [Streptomyces sp. NBC_00154]MCX5316074.1 hypothetical protein [Streptomyces sp. NBC_00154]
MAALTGVGNAACAGVVPKMVRAVVAAAMRLVRMLRRALVRMGFGTQGEELGGGLAHMMGPGGLCV